MRDGQRLHDTVGCLLGGEGCARWRAVGVAHALAGNGMVGAVGVSWQTIAIYGTSLSLRHDGCTGS